MKQLLTILFFLTTIAGFGQVNEYKIRANMYLIADSLLVIGNDTLSGTTQIDGTDTIFVTLDYLKAENISVVVQNGIEQNDVQLELEDIRANIVDKDTTNELITDISYLSNTLTITEAGIPHTVTIDAGTEWNRTTQTLTGTTPTWDVDNGINAVDTLTATTTISFVNLEDGMNGILWVKNATAQYDIYFAGYTVKIDRNVQSTSTSVTTSGLGKEDIFWWNYNGVWVQITGKLDTE